MKSNGSHGARPPFLIRLIVAIIVALLIGLVMGKGAASLDVAQWLEDHLVLGHQICETLEDGSAACGPLSIDQEGVVKVR